jgi:hypothetical protein
MNFSIVPVMARTRSCTKLAGEAYEASAAMTVATMTFPGLPRRMLVQEAPHQPGWGVGPLGPSTQCPLTARGPPVEIRQKEGITRQYSTETIEVGGIGRRITRLSYRMVPTQRLSRCATEIRVARLKPETLQYEGINWADTEEKASTWGTEGVS